MAVNEAEFNLAQNDEFKHTVNFTEYYLESSILDTSLENFKQRLAALTGEDGLGFNEHETVYKLQKNENSMEFTSENIKPVVLSTTRSLTNKNAKIQLKYYGPQSYAPERIVNSRPIV